MEVDRFADGHRTLFPKDALDLHQFFILQEKVGQLVQYPGNRYLTLVTHLQFGHFFVRKFASDHNVVEIFAGVVVDYCAARKILSQMLLFFGDVVV